MMIDKKFNLIIAVTGASGSIYAKTLFDTLEKYPLAINKIAVIFSETAKQVWQHEINEKLPEHPMFSMYQPNDFFAPFASGSSVYDSMIICPCSMGTLGRISSGTSDDLIARAADVALKEKRRLILVTRETPLNLIHINNMKVLTEAGAVIFPASPSFYSKPADMDALIRTVTDRVLALAGMDVSSFHWGE